MVKLKGFRRALRAALDGPSIKDVEWTSAGHDFNVKKVKITKSAQGLSIDGTDGKHISHRRRFRPDDQVFYKCKVTPQGDVEDLDINVKSSNDILEEWFKTAGQIAGVIAAIIGAGKSDQIDDAEPTPSSVELLDGDWQGDAEFLIANIITQAVRREMPEVAQQAAQPGGFSGQVLVVNPNIVATFVAARERLAGS